MRGCLMRRAAGVLILTCFAAAVGATAAPRAEPAGPQGAAASREAARPAAPAVAQAESAASAEQAVINRYCVTCHNDRLETGGLSLEALDITEAAAHPAVWEKALRKLRAGAMPPRPRPRPDAETYARLVTYLETALDREAALNPDPGRTETFRRMNRTEYQNAIRDLLALDMDITALLPRDDAGFGFDNVNTGGLNPTLMERYLAAAQKISRLAVGSRLPAPGSRVVVVPADRTQEAHVDGLPFGTRGGTVIRHTFPADGEYEIQVRLQRDRNENVEGMTETHQVEVLLDGERLDLIPMHPDRIRGVDGNGVVYYADEGIDNHLNVRSAITAGPHDIGATFVRKNAALVETTRQPYHARFNLDRHPRQQPAVRTVSIVGPFDPTGIGETPSRARIFSCRPSTASADDAEACATSILANLARRAYRRPVTVDDLDQLVAFYHEGHGEGGFETGIETALRALLASPEFLFRIERDPEGLAPGTPYRVSDLELASRLSFFLWSSIPDDELVEVAASGRLSDPTALDLQVRRMLSDPRAEALTTNFASQWLHLRNLDAVRPDARLFPDFDDNLRQGFRRESELLFQSILEEDRSVLDLLRADYTFVNERVARHYGIPNIYGDHFRRVTLPPGSRRAGILGHGSVLTVTSYATRTSPVLRGKWILENLLGTPPPPPPPNVPPLEESRSNLRVVSMRERMEAHRQNPQCAVCHRIMDPAGLSMENFDAIGRWRDAEGGVPIDAAGNLPGGEEFDGVAGLRAAVLERPEVFVGNVAEKLLIYALGRGLDPADAPAARAIARVAAEDDYRLSSLILAVTKSTPFRMRRSQS